MTYPFKKKLKAFTLMEILVSIAILSLILLAINAIYLNIFKSQRSIISENFSQVDMEYFLRTVANNVKLAEIGDGSLCSISDGRFFNLSTSSDITLIRDGQCLSFYLDDDDGRGVLKVELEGSYDQEISSTKTDVLDLIFQIEDDISLGQPLLTVYLKAAPVSDLDNYSEVQTSISVNY